MNIIISNQDFRFVWIQLRKRSLPGCPVVLKLLRWIQAADRLDAVENADNPETANSPSPALEYWHNDRSKDISAF